MQIAFYKKQFAPFFALCRQQLLYSLIVLYKQIQLPLFACKTKQTQSYK